MTQEENEKLMYSSPEDQAFYLKCVEGLPTLAGLNGTGKDADGIQLPYGVGPHSIRCFREVIKRINPKFIWEIGFNMGWSAAIWMELSTANLHSCDISTKQETIIAADILSKKYGERFYYSNVENQRDTWGTHRPHNYDLVFIDGSHLLNDVVYDITVSLNLKIPYLFFDDILPDFGYVHEAIDLYKDKIELIFTMGNMSLYKNISL